MYKSYLSLFSVIALVGCGGGGTGGIVPIAPGPGTPGPGIPGPGTPSTAVTLATGDVTSATAGVPGPFDTILPDANAIAPQTITFLGNSNPSNVSYSSDLTFVSAGGRNFSFVEGADGASFALIGIPFNNAGSFISAATPAPTSGSATYTGDYFGRHDGAGITVSNPFIEGTITLTADFDDNNFSGLITNRTVVVGNAGANAAAFTEDVAFAGLMSDDGIMQGTHTDPNSTGTINAIAFDAGAVGTLSISHAEGRLPLFPGSTVCGFGASAACTLNETGVFSAD